MPFDNKPIHIRNFQPRRSHRRCDLKSSPPKASSCAFDQKLSPGSCFTSSPGVRRCLVGRPLGADIDQRQLGLFGESLALGLKPKAVRELPVAAAQFPRPDVSPKHPPQPVKVEPPPRWRLQPSQFIRAILPKGGAQQLRLFVVFGSRLLFA